MIPAEYTTWMVLALLAICVGLPAYLAFFLGIKFAKIRQPEFFSSRRELDDVYLPLHEADIHHAWAAFLVGRKLSQSGRGYEKLERLILPDPEAQSIEDFEKSLPDQMPLIRDIRSATRTAISRGVEVRWCKHFTGYSWWVAEPRGNDGFVHVELVMPYSIQGQRPSIRIYRSTDERLVQQYVSLYENLWRASRVPEQCEYDLAEQTG